MLGHRILLVVGAPTMVREPGCHEVASSATGRRPSCDVSVSDRGHPTTTPWLPDVPFPQTNRQTASMPTPRTSPSPRPAAEREAEYRDFWDRRPDGSTEPRKAAFADTVDVVAQAPRQAQAPPVALAPPFSERSSPSPGPHRSENTNAAGQAAERSRRPHPSDERRAGRPRLLAGLRRTLVPDRSSTRATSVRASRRHRRPRRRRWCGRFLPRSGSGSLPPVRDLLHPQGAA